MINIAKKVESIFDKGRRFIKSVVRGQNDTQTASEVAPFGIDGIAPNNWRALFMQTEDQSEKVVVGYINLGQLESLTEGESRLYSTDPDGALSIAIYLRGDGTMEVGGDTDFMVRYNALETAFNELKADFNALVGEYNAHVHDGVIVAVSGGSGAPAVGTPGDSAPPTSSGDQSSADITPAKIDEIKTI